MKRVRLITFFVAIFGLLMCLIGYRALAFVSSSNSFRLQYDSLNSEGGSSDSATYNLKDSMGEQAAGVSSSDSFKIKSGFWHMGETNISISSPSDFSLSPSIGGVSGGTASGSVIWNVATDSPSGYTLNIRSASSPALSAGSYSLSDFSPADGDIPDFEWTINQTDSEFGFSPEGSDVVLKFKDDGFNTCGTGSQNSTNKCWYNFKTTDETISQSTGTNNPAGTNTEFKLKAQVGNSRFQPEGDYTAQLIVTAMVN